MKKKQTKLRNLINESVLGQLPSSQMFKYNKATGTYEAPGKHSTNEEIEDQLAEGLPTHQVNTELGQLEDAKDFRELLDSLLKTGDSKYTAIILKQLYTADPNVLKIMYSALQKVLKSNPKGLV